VFKRGAKHTPKPGISALLEDFLDDTPEAGESIRLEMMLERFQRRAFGVFLLISVLPSYIPVAIGIGAVSGILCIMCGVQMMLGFEKPWLPKMARDFSLQRKSLANFSRKVQPTFRFLERVITERLPRFTSRHADMFSGLIIALMGVALSLPVPLTNFFFAIPLSIFALALIERDGAVIALCWFASIVTMIGFYYLGDALVHYVIGLFK
jgi:hypothetical protein